MELVQGEELNKIEQTFRLLRQFALTQGYQFVEGASSGNSYTQLMAALLARPRLTAPWNGYGYKPNTGAFMTINSDGLDDYNPTGDYYFGSNNSGVYDNLGTPKDVRAGENNFLLYFSVDGAQSEYKFFRNSDGSQWWGLEELAPNIYTVKMVGRDGKTCYYGAFALEPAIIYKMGFTFNDYNYVLTIHNQGADGTERTYLTWDGVGSNVTTNPQMEGAFEVLCNTPIIALDSAGFSFVGFETWHDLTEWGFYTWSGFDKSLAEITTIYGKTPYKLTITGHSSTNWGESLSWMG